MQHDISRDKIKAYLSGAMKGEERAKFEREIESNEYLAAEVEWMRLEKNMVEVKREDQFREKMKDWEALYRKKERRKDWQKSLLDKWKLIIEALVVTSLVFWGYDYLPQEEDMPKKTEIKTEPNKTKGSQPMESKNGPKSPNPPSLNPDPSKPPRKDQVVIDKPNQTPNHPPIETVSMAPLRLAMLRSVSDRLNTAGNGNDWRMKFSQEDYAETWRLLQPLVKNTDGELEPPEAFYCAALLKLYWNPTIDVDAGAILNKISYINLASSLRGFDEAKFTQHKVIAHYMVSDPARADSLIKLAQTPDWLEYQLPSFSL